MENNNNEKDHLARYGEVKIADDVVATIAGLAATEIEGVAFLQGNMTHELVKKVGAKNLSKGVKIEMNDNFVNVDLSLVVKYGYSIPKTTAKIQENVKTSIEMMTGLKVLEINIRIIGVTLNNH